MGRKRKPDVITITVTQKHGAKVIEKTKYGREMLPGETLDAIKAMIENIADTQTNTTQTNGTTNIINYAAGTPSDCSSAAAVG